MAYRYSVLMYIVNNYEIVREIYEKDPECEYILVTDDKNLTSKTWKVIYDESLKNMSIFDRCYSIRFGLFNYCSTNICIYLDGSVQIKKSLKPLIDCYHASNEPIQSQPHDISKPDMKYVFNKLVPCLYLL